MTPPRQRETILEFRVSGAFGQINAIDVETGIEVSVTVPAVIAKMDRETLALRKLTRALVQAGEVESGEPSHENGGNPQGMPPSKRPGLIA